MPNCSLGRASNPMVSPRGDAAPVRTGGQIVDAFVEHFHHAIVVAIDGDFAGPNRAPHFNLHSKIGCKYPRPRHPSKAFSHTFEKTRLIVAPLSMIIATNKISDSFPVSVVDDVKEILGVAEPDAQLAKARADTRR